MPENDDPDTTPEFLNGGNDSEKKSEAKSKMKKAASMAIKAKTGGVGPDDIPDEGRKGDSWSALKKFKKDQGIGTKKAASSVKDVIEGISSEIAGEDLSADNSPSPRLEPPKPKKKPTPFDTKPRPQ